MTDIQLSPNLADQLQDTDHPAAVLREELERQDQELQTSFAEGEDVVELVTRRSRVMDQLLELLWDSFFPGHPEAALVAVGGYGREELFPHSDVDLLILLGDDQAASLEEPITRFVTALWDLRIKVGHSVRTVAECIEHGTEDVTIATNLFESRCITGDAPLFERLGEALEQPDFWPTKAFFRAKVAEQQTRHGKFEHSGSKIEPNVKESPGGLRDVQMISWVTLRHFGTGDFFELVEHGFLTAEEHQQLTEGRRFLFRLRFALHLLAGRTEDRLLLDFQQDIAHQFGYAGTGINQAVEQFMQSYFRTVLELRRLNDMLLQLFEEAILLKGERQSPCPIDTDFQTRIGYLETVTEDLFDRRPAAIMELFLLLARMPALRGVRAETIRQIRSYRDRIDDDFRNDPAVTEAFMEILRQTEGLYRVLQMMNRYGVLAAYIPEFEHVVGRMQFDLFHVYTVDEHTLFVIRNLRRLAVPEHRQEFPLCSDIYKELQRPERLIIAALFHDIAKGRGGNHEILGADDARAFCQRHNLSRKDTELIAWLVRHHLLMSFTAQRRDISDPQVIAEFARQVDSPLRLKMLYVLTVADIRATNPSLWNSWRDALLRELYLNTLQALTEDAEALPDEQDVVQSTRDEALKRLQEKDEAIDPAAIETFWSQLPDEYFLQRSAEETAWHTGLCLQAWHQQPPIVGIRHNRERHCTEIALYVRDQPFLFTRATSLLSQMGLNVVSASVTTSADGFSLDTFHVLGPNGQPLEDRWILDDLRDALRRTLQESGPPDTLPARHLSRRKRQFSVPTEIEFFQDKYKDRTIVQIQTADFPGLLSRIARGFAEADVQIQSAKVATLGERVEDIFFVTDAQGRAIIDPARLDALAEMLRSSIRTDDD